MYCLVLYAGLAIGRVWLGLKVMMIANSSMPLWNTGAFEWNWFSHCFSPSVACVSAVFMSALVECPFFHLAWNHVGRSGWLFSMRLHADRWAWCLIRCPGISHGVSWYSLSNVCITPLLSCACFHVLVCFGFCPCACCQVLCWLCCCWCHLAAMMMVVSSPPVSAAAELW